jgi:type II secretory pathway component PulK
MATSGELGWIDGFSPDYLDRPIPSRDREAPPIFRRERLTVIPVEHRRPVAANVNTAAPEVLLGILGLEGEGMVETFLAYREQQPISSLIPFLASLPERERNTVRLYLDVKSRFFRIHGTARYDTTTRSVATLVERDAKGDVKTIQWLR